ncbi:hypothetical protein HMI56_003583 [Coelomomyces lativittatus]|nr:hypothetical protein HMI56_003583 [Coelomomyces lativittatus]
MEFHGWNLFFILLQLDKIVGNEKILFKFIQDGEWCCSEDYQKDYSQGYENHSLEYTPDYKPPLQFQDYVDASMKIEEKILFSSFERTVKDSKLYGSEDLVAVPLPNLKNGFGKKMKKRIGKLMLKWITYLLTNVLFPPKPKIYKSMYVPTVRKPSQSWSIFNRF